MDLRCPRNIPKIFNAASIELVKDQYKAGLANKKGCERENITAEREAPLDRQSEADENGNYESRASVPTYFRDLTLLLESNGRTRRQPK